VMSAASASISGNPAVCLRGNVADSACMHGGHGAAQSAPCCLSLSCAAFLTADYPPADSGAIRARRARHANDGTIEGACRLRIDRPPISAP
jgi:hypothetical protein